jgi:hypothetical protein
MGLTLRPKPSLIWGGGGAFRPVKQNLLLKTKKYKYMQNLMIYMVLIKIHKKIRHVVCEGCCTGFLDSVQAPGF